MSTKSAFVIGYTGETGKSLVKELVSSKIFHRIILIGRRTVDYSDAELQALDQKVVDFENLDDYKDAFAGFDEAFCCLGTTRGQAGSKEAFIKIDHDYVLKVAELCKEGGTKHFHYQSSSGADKNSMFLYPKTKGLIEEALTSLKFDRVSIYRPKLLVCERENKRAGEQIFKVICAPIGYFKPSLVYTPTVTMAKAMIANAFTPPTASSEIIFNDKIFELASAAYSTT